MERSVIMDNEKDLILKLARAKALYINLCDMIDIRSSILMGRIRGSKDDWKAIKDTLERGKVFFDGVKGIREFVKNFPLEGDCSNEKGSIT